MGENHLGVFSLSTAALLQGDRQQLRGAKRAAAVLNREDDGDAFSFRREGWPCDTAGCLQFSENFAEIVEPCRSTHLRSHRFEQPRLRRTNFADQLPVVVE